MEVRERRPKVGLYVRIDDKVLAFYDYLAKKYNHSKSSFFNEVFKTIYPHIWDEFLVQWEGKESKKPEKKPAKKKPAKKKTVKRKKVVSKRR